MDDDFDFDLADIPAEELFALVDNAQSQSANSQPLQKSAVAAYPAPPDDNHGTRHILPPSARLIRNPISFGDTDARTLDAGVLDDGGKSLLLDAKPGFRNDIRADGASLTHEAKARNSLLNGTSGSVKEHAPLYNVPPELEDTASEEEMDIIHDGGKVNGNRETVDTVELMEQLEQLTRERERLYQELEAAKTESETRAGEIAIIRANQAKLEQGQSRQLLALRSARDEELEKHQAEIDALVMESKRLTTENQFLKQDLKEEAFRFNEMQQNRKAKSKVDDLAPTTPKKPKVLPLRDGFDDDELIASPTKSAGRRSKRGTPSAPGKRKRTIPDDSPIVPALQLSQSFESETLAAAEPPNAIHSEPVLDKKYSEDRALQLVQRILKHKTYPRKVSDLEAFADISFPSEPGKMFSSYILQATTTKPSQNFVVEYGKAVISLWARALKEKFYKPVSMLMSIVRFIITLDTTTIAPLLIADLVPVIEKSAYVNGVPRFTNSPVSHTNFGQVKQTPQKELYPLVNGTEALELLYLAANACSHTGGALQRAWRLICCDFILMMLNSYQPIKDIILILNLLSCSIFSTTFGPILNSPADQVANQNYLIDRIANLLQEQPSVDEGETPYTSWDIATLRYEAMSLLQEIAFSCPSPTPQQNYAARMIATHPSALARVFRAMHDELDSLYSYPPERELRAATVNGLTHLAYGVIMTFPDVVDLPTKLRGFPGAVQKHLVVLTRLAFSEGPVLEAGITDETVEMAHEMLEDTVNPQEAEALLEAFRPSKTLQRTLPDT
ncbi:hypothetical protein LOZ61_004486 [Ophidiomyces ophidiicola]|uniref:Uncharacterized protein n=1 Tax=Ophidiomyces ophidiicola TaxID=1387563 RepID=A0ACB8V5H9_9EURO|nr:hypothetical protein LOZ61_004486 [Ophidiomyces ophidiicola]KAI1925632.1 hypothetical protein LOZ60_004053 [Ophidiomyces ophidiicola]KAI2131888.1 hypothetical protein LOZ31_000255 [Ophidiomyces ophidiicola]KAI2148051.1 hypothetical protein LOZ27_002081 [Ophidiomyces ophidiicola]KAI2193863.1 hypothetical protein LOZ20_004020 [Ophidiomyces ophidiicola]